jgi:hypothetical protein
MTAANEPAMSLLRFAALAALVVGGSFDAACAAGTDADHERAVDAAAAAPAGPRPACPVFTRGGECQPLAPEDLVTLATGGMVLPAAWFPTNTGGALAFGVRWTEGRIVAARSAHALAFEPSLDLPFEGASGATGVTVDGGPALYVVARSGSYTRLQLARIIDGDVGPPAPVDMDGANVVPEWPEAVGLPDGRVLLTFVEPQSRVFAGVDDGGGTHFTMAEVPLNEQSLTGVLAHVGITQSGSWLLAYQVADASWRFRASVLVSTDSGASWRPPIALPAGDGETVSDAFPIARVDRGADIYYASGALQHETIRRRSLHEDGTLGPEQIVTSDAVGRVQKPQPRRLADGRVTMLFTADRGSTAGILALAVLDGDAPW